DAIRKLMEMAAELGAVGPISVPIFNRMERLPDLSPYRSRHELEKELLVHLLGEIGTHGEAVGSCLLLEPLNRYESNALVDIEEGAEVCRVVGSPGVRLIADFFHMQIEQPDIPTSLRAVADVLSHCHLADSTRKEPGSGSLDFRPGFAALKEIGYDGYMALECGLTGPADEVLPSSVEYLRACIEG
ncbi:MAG: sugar phosphate isomerase/epimerase, partial [bacterium]|nr:sugar phosphate isomerase/epimerase [bacterium]